MTLLERFYQYAACVQIAHHLPGRLRLRLVQDRQIPGTPRDTAYLLTQATLFRDMLESIPGVRSIRFNLMARSCTVEYDQRVIPFKSWPDFLNDVPSDEARALRRIIEDRCAEVAGA